jgi:ABC-type multidrug transport system ATPase subunit
LIQGLKRNGTTIFLTTHYLDEAEVLSDHIVIMNKGKKVAEGSPREIIKRYGSHPIMTLIGAGQKGLDAMRKNGADAILKENDVIMHISNTCDIQDLISQLTEAGVEVSDMYIKRDTLEDVFLSLIGSDKQEVVG